MSFESAFLELMPSTVTISTRSSHNSYGEASYGSGTSYRARVVAQTGFVRAAGGFGLSGHFETVEVRTVVWIASTGVITTDDRITLPDGTTPPIVAVERYPDEDGTHHHKLMLGWVRGGRG